MSGDGMNRASAGRRDDTVGVSYLTLKLTTRPRRNQNYLNCYAPACTIHVPILAI
jgi:hypothetical protein